MAELRADTMQTNIQINWCQVGKPSAARKALMTANGKANTAVRAEYRQAAPAIMALKKKSTRKQILAAMCSDHTARATNVQIFDALQYQEARHDWTPRVIRRAERDIVNDRFC